MKSQEYSEMNENNLNEKLYNTRKVNCFAWDTLKGRPIPRKHQEFVDSKQRLRAALRNLKNIEDLPSSGEYRRYQINDYQEQRETEKKVDLPCVPIKVNDLPVLPKRKSSRKIKIEKCMYYEDSSSDSWTPGFKPSRKSKKQANHRRNTHLKETRECSETEQPGPSTSKSNQCKIAEKDKDKIYELYASHFPKNETIPKAGETYIIKPKKEKDIVPKEETGAIPKRETGAIPKRGTSAFPKSDASTIPTKETGAIPKRNKSATSQRETGAILQRETGATPKRNKGATSQRETGSILQRETGATSKRETGAIPQKEMGAIPEKETGAIQKKETGAIQKKETGASRKARLPRSLACILESQNINYDKSIEPRRKTKVSQEVWASTLDMNPEPKYYPEENQPTGWALSVDMNKEPKYHPKENQMGPSTSQEPSTSSKSDENSRGNRKNRELNIPQEPTITSKCNEKSKNRPKKKASKNKNKKKSEESVPSTEAASKSKEKSRGSVATAEPSLEFRLPIKQEVVDDPNDELQSFTTNAPSYNNARLEEPGAKHEPIKDEILEEPLFSTHAEAWGSRYNEEFFSARYDEDYLTRSYIENERDRVWFNGKGASDHVFEIEPLFPENEPPMTVLGVELNALENFLRNNETI
ncbi:peptidyl-prolyl cis-trans isomerase 1-like isoform X2 [Argiope bruennichi]|uniref:peptidyl-prolyl cis-trans isomerase 1-like isoform X2 n=1 Tax=Argiope bruennichi TaxID=94029 RepID=UPI0024940515|nr:peptidyl-prolyl cis-trans isomerase 1-like isoform X2 [Argiope bruennichi]